MITIFSTISRVSIKNNKTAVLLVFLCFFGNAFLFSQPMNKNNPFISPVDFDIKLSGNFAELRGSHFHTGIDIKTKGTTGHNIYAIYDGYVSRIKVSPYGYGNALYIRHPNGYTSVYAHLESFNIQIEQYVREHQYEKKTFALNLYPEKDLIKLEKGDVIGKSGNSGGSLGPHLHFEIRKTANEKPQNPMFWDFNIEDNIKPRFHYAILYPLSFGAHIENKADKKVFTLKKSGGNYQLKNKPVVEVADTIGIGVYVNDYLNNSYNRCGVHQLKMYADNELMFHLQLDELSFAENRYILSHMDYALKTERKIKAHKCFIDDGNNFSAYKTPKDKGKIYVAPGVRKEIMVEAIDVYGNKSELNFTLVGKPALEKPEIPAAADVFMPGQTNHFQRNDIHLIIPTKALYKKVYFTYEMRKGNVEMWSDIHTLHNYREPLHKHFNVSIKTNPVPINLRKKLYIASVDESGKTRSATSTARYDDGWVHARIRQFGSFCVMADTIIPEIKPVNISQNKDMTGENSIIVDITDSETGIQSYDGYINGDWVLFEYDAKNDRLRYNFDEHLPDDESYTLKLIIKDRKENTAVKTINFVRLLSETKK